MRIYYYFILAKSNRLNFICRTGEWKVFSGNEIGALLGWWAVQCYKEKNPGDSLSDCYLLASTVSSKILAAVAKIEGLHFEETLTGFKWMGKWLFNFSNILVSIDHHLSYYILFSP